MIQAEAINRVAFQEKLFLSVVSYLSSADIQELRHSLSEKGYVVFKNLIKHEALSVLKNEALLLLEKYGVQRDFLMQQTDNTPRKLINIGQRDIKNNGGVIPELYLSPIFKSVFEAVTQEKFHDCPYQKEEYIINCLLRPSDTHGWHWDDYKYGIVIALETPQIGYGGFVQAVPNTRWNRQSPSVETAFLQSNVHSFRLDEGDVYLLKTDTSMHRVFPIKEGARRIIINMVWATDDELNKEIDHSTMEAFFQ